MTEFDVDDLESDPAEREAELVRLRRDDPVPADLIVLHASGPNGIAYIETVALDGETNLKTKQACALLSEHCESLAGMAACGAEIVSEDPNLDLYNYEGRVLVNGEAMPLTLNQVVFRGSVSASSSRASSSRSGRTPAPSGTAAPAARSAWPIPSIASPSAT